MFGGTLNLTLSIYLEKNAKSLRKNAALVLVINAREQLHGTTNLIDVQIESSLSTEINRSLTVMSLLALFALTEQTSVTLHPRAVAHK